MRIVAVWLGMLAVATLSAGAQSNLVIESFELPGLLQFNRVSNAVPYRVEWSSAAGGAWSSSWDSLANLSGVGSGPVTAAVPMLYRVVAMVATPPAGMVLISAGTYVMGNATNVLPVAEGWTNELPQHAVTVSGFFMDRHEVTKALWDEVKAFNGGNGYSYANPGSGKATNHPVHTVNWSDAVKWCNARSQKEGLTPVYYTDQGFTTVYKTNQIVPYVDWSADGYRLPTEAEWEKAGRGGAADTRFPWTDFTNMISHTKANYRGPTSLSGYNLSTNYHPVFATNGLPYTSPVGYFPPNGYGLYDMAGNVWEWCWDWYDTAYYAVSPGMDPRGPAGPLSERVMRGGSWNDISAYARVAFRSFAEPTFSYHSIGLRCVRGL